MVSYDSINIRLSFRLEMSSQGSPGCRQQNKYEVSRIYEARLLSMERSRTSDYTLLGILLFRIQYPTTPGRSVSIRRCVPAPAALHCHPRGEESMFLVDYKGKDKDIMTLAPLSITIRKS